MPRPISRADFARLAGVSGMAITKWATGPGAEAGLGSRIDLDHPTALSYLARKGVEPPKVEPPPPPPPTQIVSITERKKRKPAQQKEPSKAPVSNKETKQIESIDLEKDFDKYADLTLRELIARHGSAQGVKDWLDALKKIVDIHEKDLKNSETEGRLIERELVKVHIFGAIEASHRRLLADASKTIAMSLYPMARRGESIDEGEKVVRDVIGKILAQVKATATRVLRNA